MKPRGVGMGWLCVAMLCSGAALLVKEEPGHQSTTQRADIPQPKGDPTTTPGDVATPTITPTPPWTWDPIATPGDEDTPTTWPTMTPTPAWTWDPIATPVPTQAGAAGNKTPSSSAVPIRYWSPAIFVLVALFVLFFTYWRTRGEGTRDRATTASDSSDLGALDHVPTQDTTPIISSPQEERKEPENPPTTHTETTFCLPDPPTPQPQPDTPTATDGPHCSGETGAD